MSWLALMISQDLPFPQFDCLTFLVQLDFSIRKICSFSIQHCFWWQVYIIVNLLSLFSISGDRAKSMIDQEWSESPPKLAENESKYVFDCTTDFLCLKNRLAFVSSCKMVPAWTFPVVLYYFSEFNFVDKVLSPYLPSPFIVSMLEWVG